MGIKKEGNAGSDGISVASCCVPLQVCFESAGRAVESHLLLFFGGFLLGRLLLCGLFGRSLFGHSFFCRGFLFRGLFGRSFLAASGFLLGSALLDHYRVPSFRLGFFVERFTILELNLRQPSMTCQDKTIRFEKSFHRVPGQRFQGSAPDGEVHAKKKKCRVESGKIKFENFFMRGARCADGARRNRDSIIRKHSRRARRKRWVLH